MRATAIGRFALRVSYTIVLAATAVALVPFSARGNTYSGWFDYNRNNSNVAGCLSWGFVINDYPRVHALYWRAGSGSQLNDHTYGWLPAGFYKIMGHWDDYNGTKIWGRVWRLSDKYNEHGTLRTQLFIHTEETRYNGQYNPTTGDDPQCWEGDGDYASLGCIKLGYPADIDSAHWYWNYRGGTTAHGSGAPYPMPDRLYVHG